MVKIFASDMDKTFLTSQSEVPKNFSATLKKIHEEELHFVLASGRALYNMKNKMKDYVDKLDFVSDNGAFVSIQGETIYKSVMDKDIIHKLILEGRKLKETSLVLVGEKTAYVELFDEHHSGLLYEYYLDFDIVEDLTLIEEDIVKVTFLNTDSIHDIFEQELQPLFKDFVNIVLSGEIWIDAMNKNVNKGNSLLKVLDYYGLDSSELVSFGDYHNDIQMMQLAGKSYAVDNAHIDVKDIADEIIDNNDSNAVLRKIEEYLRQS